LGNQQDTRGTAFVVYDDIFDAKNACEHLSGFNLGGRYLICLYHSQQKAANAKSELTAKEQELRDLKRRAPI
jgi:pre-mRNA branch site protein p14